MPTRHTTRGTPVVQFDPQLEVPPYTVYRRLKEGDPPLLIDVRPAGGRLALMGARAMPAPDWTPPKEMDVVLLDDDGATAVEMARRLQAAGFPKVRALFGGLQLYEFSLDQQVVGAENYLIKAQT
jgi:rhodanese-related sulfurtransferase